MLLDSPYLVRPGAAFSVADIDPRDKGAFKDKQDAEQPTQNNLDYIAKTQELLYAEGQRSLLVVLQAMDAGGKDGTIRFVFGGVNPQGCRVTS